MSDEQKSLLEFPCLFPVKVIGNDEDTKLVELVLELVLSHYPNFNSDNLSSRPSKNGKYTAITLQIYAESQTELDNLYQTLTSHERIHMVL